MTPLPLVKEEMDVQKCMYSMYMYFSKVRLISPSTGRHGL